MHEDLINSLNHFTKLSPIELEAFSARVSELILEKNTCWIEEGQVANHIAFIRKGYLRTFFSKEGNEITRDISSRNSFFTAFTSFITEMPSFEIINTITDCELLLISREDLNYLYQNFSAWQTIGRRVVEEMFVRSQKRIYSLITVSAEERYIRLLKEKPDMIQNVPLQYIASYLGITQQSLSRLRRKITHP
jgi:CRP/FNR family transcriptional regulator, anaerobic regulatory protein